MGIAPESIVLELACMPTLRTHARALFLARHFRRNGTNDMIDDLA